MDMISTNEALNTIAWVLYFGTPIIIVLARCQQEYDELVMFVDSTENIPKSVFTLLAKQQETLSNEMLKLNELLHSIKRKYS